MTDNILVILVFLMQKNFMNDFQLNFASKKYKEHAIIKKVTLQGLVKM